MGRKGDERHCGELEKQREKQMKKKLNEKRREGGALKRYVEDVHVGCVTLFVSSFQGDGMLNSVAGRLLI